MKIIGMIVAVEIQSVLKRYGAKLVKRKETAGYQAVSYTHLCQHHWKSSVTLKVELPDAVFVFSNDIVMLEIIG